MKHFTTISKSAPAMAFTDDHPGGLASIWALIQNPIGVLTMHVNYLISFFTAAILGDKELS